VLDRFRFVPIRLLQSIPVVIGVTIVVFFMVHLLPGNPALTILGQTATPERVAALNTQLGLDKP
jgi:peptide/nickel transport system permease protein